MRAHTKSLLQKLLIVVSVCLLAIGLAACAETTASVEVKNVTLTAAEGSLGVVEKTHTLSYTATEGSTVSVSVTLNGDEPLDSDYTYTESSKAMVFHTMGEYEITVKASLSGATDSESVTVHVKDKAPALSDLSIAAQSGTTSGKLGAYALSYTAEEGSTVSVKAEKNGAPATAADYSYENNVITFTQAGNYEIFVTAKLGYRTTTISKRIGVNAANAPEVSNISFTAKAGTNQGKTGIYTVAYTASPNSTVAISAYHNGVAANSDVCAFNGNEVAFYAAGEYQMLFTALKNGTLAYYYETVVIGAYATAPTVAYLEAIAMDATGFMRGQPVKINYYVDKPTAEYPASDTHVAVTFDERVYDDVFDEYVYETAPAIHYDYNATTSTVVFNKAGNYKVTVTATAHGMKSTASQVISIGEYAKPNLSFAIEQTQFCQQDGSNEGTGMLTSGYTLTASCIDSYDSIASSGITAVEYRASELASWTTVAAEKYTVTAEAFTFAGSAEIGQYRITATAVTERDMQIHKSVIVTMTANMLILHDTDGRGYDVNTQKWVNVAKGTSLTLHYETTGALLTNYDNNVPVVTGDYASNNTKKFKNFNASEKTIELDTSEVGTYEAKITYKHDSDSNRDAALVYKICVVEDVDNAPVFVGDPFDGTYHEIIPSTGLLLYYSAVDKYDHELSASDVSFEITANTVSTPTSGKTATPVIKSLYDNINFRYLIVENFEDNKATGDVTVKLTATKDGASAVSYKTFTLTACGGTKEDDYDGDELQDYFKKIVTNAAANSFSVSNMSFDQRQNAIVTKEGVIVHRAYGSGSIARIDINSDSAISGGTSVDNFDVEFDFMPIKRQKGSNNKDISSLILNWRTGGWDGWVNAGKIILFSDNPDSISCNSWDNDWNKKGNGEGDPGPINGGVIEGRKIHVKLEHRVNGSTVSVAVYWTEPGGAIYKRMNEFTAAVSSTAGKAGAPVAAIQVDWEVGCFEFGNVTVTKY